MLLFLPLPFVLPYEEASTLFQEYGRYGKNIKAKEQSISPFWGLSREKLRKQQALRHSEKTGKRIGREEVPVGPAQTRGESPGLGQGGRMRLGVT